MTKKNIQHLSLSFYITPFVCFKIFFTFYVAPLHCIALDAVNSQRSGKILNTKFKHNPGLRAARDQEEKII